VPNYLIPIQRTYDFISNHPLGSKHKLRACRNWLGWQVRSRISNGAHAVPFVGKTRLLVSRGMHGATGNIYCGLQEFEDMAFVMHFLRADDLFVDIGANIGSYTVLASGHCGARTVAIEPVAETAEKLQANIDINRLQKMVRAERCVLAEKEGLAHMSSGLDCTNHVLAEDEMQVGTTVPQKSLDSLLDGEMPTMLKIDVEGYELPVLKGASATIASPTLQAVIVEANNSGQRYGFSQMEVFEVLSDNGFIQVSYDPFERFISGACVTSSGNALFLKNTESAQERVRIAPAVELLGHKI
jgi:FkbM family methyltransferase